MIGQSVIHYALGRAGEQSIRTACQRILRSWSPFWTTAARPVTCDDCQRTRFFCERRAARGLN